MVSRKTLESYKLIVGFWNHNQNLPEKDRRLLIQKQINCGNRKINSALKKYQVEYKKPKKNPKKRLYWVSSDMYEEGMGIAFVSDSIQNAKYGSGIDYDEFISLKVKWVKHIDASDLPYGEIEARFGLLKGIYSYLEYEKCDRCGEESTVEAYNNKILCYCCIDELVSAKKFLVQILDVNGAGEELENKTVKFETREEAEQFSIRKEEEGYMVNPIQELVT